MLQEEAHTYATTVTLSFRLETHTLIDKMHMNAISLRKYVYEVRAQQMTGLQIYTKNNLRVTIK